VCEHKRQRQHCIECGGANVCEHKRQRRRCIECGGANVCEHKRRRQNCIECGGANVCEHKRRRQDCMDCMSVDEAIKSRYVCTICLSTSLSGYRVHIGICARCDKTERPRIEHTVRDLMQGLLVPPTYMDDKLIGGAECDSNRTRPDLCWVRGDRIVHVEVDEDSHADRQVLCELQKIDAANWGLSGFGHVHLPTWIVRFNCSNYDGRDISLEDRVAVLVAYVNKLLTEPTDIWDLLRVNVTYCFYHRKGQKHIDAARAVESVTVQEVIV
jgi:hypothetical protein